MGPLSAITNSFVLKTLFKCRALTSRVSQPFGMGPVPVQDTHGRTMSFRQPLLQRLTQLLPTAGEKLRSLWQREASPDKLALKSAEEKLKLQIAALEATVDAVIITDREGRIEWANPAFTALSGYDRSEVIGRTPGEIVKSGTHPATFYRDMWNTINAGRVWRGEMVNRRRDGTLYHENQTITPVLDSAARISHFVAIKRDVSEQRAHQSELENYRDHLESLVANRTRALAAAVEQARLIADSCADGILCIDLEGRCTFANPAACRILGYQQSQLVGQKSHVLIHHTRSDGRPYPAEECPAEIALRRGVTCTLEDEVFWHADGHGIPVFYSTHPMMLDGATIGAVVSFFDITERKRAEREREQVRQEGLRLARVKSEFIANMSHEIRTPLNGVIGLAQIGIRNSHGRGTQETYKQILESGRLLLEIVNDVLDFSKIEAGKLKIELMPANLEEVLERAMGLMRPRALEKGLCLTVERENGLPTTCFTDPLRLSQILINLLANAIKFTDKGKVTLRVSALSGELSLQVSDTGIGMSEAQQGNLFTPFEQGDGSITRRFGGTGLGLAITHNLVELMGGHIHVSSQPGAGSTFTVTLPLSVINASAPTSVPGTPTRRLEGLRVLVAEDNEINQIIISDHLAQEGARFALVGNGQHAVDLVRENGPDHYDVVLMDLMMPAMDGFEATRHIRNLAPDLPVVGQTASALEEERERCAAAGMVAHITKPIDPDTLVSVILQVLDVKTENAGNMSAGTPKPPSAPEASCDTETDSRK